MPLPTKTDEFNAALMQLAANYGRVVKFRYAKGDGDVIETRTLLPMEVRTVGRTKLFIGTDPDRDNEFRAYRIDRMKGEVTIA